MSKENCLLLLKWSKLQRFKFWKRLYVHYVAFRKVTEALWTNVHFLKFDGSKYVHSVAFRKTPLIFYFQHWAICNMRCFYNFLTPPLIQRRQEIAIWSFHTHEITDFTACWIFCLSVQERLSLELDHIMTRKKILDILSLIVAIIYMIVCCAIIYGIIIGLKGANDKSI